MGFTKKKELIYVDNKFIGWCIGYSLCTVYMPGIEYGTIELQNFGYCPSSKEFYYNKNVHLPKYLRDYFNGAVYNDDNVKRMEELGIYNGGDFYKLIRLYEEAKDDVASAKIQEGIRRDEILNFSRTLKKRS